MRGPEIELYGTSINISIKHIRCKNISNKQYADSTGKTIMYC